MYVCQDFKKTFNSLWDSGVGRNRFIKYYLDARPKFELGSSET